MSTEQRLAISEEGRRVAWFDLWVTTPFALPFFAEIYVSLVYYVHFQLGFGGTVPGFAPIHWMFINIMGVLAVLWALIRLRLPIREFALADAYARLVVAALIVYWIWLGATPVLAAFVVTEIAGALYVVWPRRPNSAA